MPEYVVQKLADALNAQGKAVKGAKVLLMGLAYKKDVDDPRESPAFKILTRWSRRARSPTTAIPTSPTCR